MEKHFKIASQFSCPQTYLFNWHEQAGAFQRLIPPWKSVRVIDSDYRITNGSRTVFSIGIGLVSAKWEAIHQGYQYPERFIDVQKSGPFKSWEHQHLFSESPEGSLLTDDVTHKLPAGMVGEWFLSRKIEDDIEQMFKFRHHRTRNDLSRLADFSGQSMKIAISGCSGLIGSELRAFLLGGGHEVIRISRNPTDDPGEAYWDSVKGELDTTNLEGLDAFIHLAGENIAGKRWTTNQKLRLYNSRVDGTRKIAEALAKCAEPPKAFICASATGIYGDTGDQWVEEASVGSPDSFLASICRDWEGACEPLKSCSRVVHSRFGIVISPKGGALKNMLLPFKLGLGGKVGNGRQYWSWISLDDAVYSLARLIRDESFVGPVNIVSPQVLTNLEFTKILGRVLGRPTLFPIPALMARAAFGEMAEALLLCSCRVKPLKLQQGKFEFAYPELEGVLSDYLGKNKTVSKVATGVSQ